MRSSDVTRKTGETDISLSLNLDGSGQSDLATGVGFFDHMLTHLSRHGQMDLRVHAKGDLHIDPHHTVEDAGICLGKAFSEALGDAAGIERFGYALIPMDEALAEVAIDCSGRPFLVFNADLPKIRLGDFDVELAEEFFQAFSVHARVTLHINLRYARNTHHAVEVIFKAFARALRMAVRRDTGITGIPSTKGMLER
ncbi:MAG: imidazoleglycerol-phosphate dehydratase HisB [Candidatus Hydrogenedentes bacterium]|nr:imidazoleglycerol-phosphate dehydratase HisB [Candidatus Hydrogenedentota bacterium]